jgi:hypothetical protein
MHPTVKPVALVIDAVKDCSRRGEIVLDPFSGSGTTIIAAEKSQRRARAVEIDPVCGQKGERAETGAAAQEQAPRRIGHEFRRIPNEKAGIRMASVAKSGRPSNARRATCV